MRCPANADHRSHRVQSETSNPTTREPPHTTPAHRVPTPCQTAPSNPPTRPTRNRPTAAPIPTPSASTTAQNDPPTADTEPASPKAPSTAPAAGGEGSWKAGRTRRLSGTSCPSRTTLYRFASTLLRLGLSHRLNRFLRFLKPDTQRCLGGIHYFTAPTRVRLEATDLPSRASLHHRPQTQGPERVLYRPVSKHPRCTTRRNLGWNRIRSRCPRPPDPQSPTQPPPFRFDPTAGRFRSTPRARSANRACFDGNLKGVLPVDAQSWRSVRS